MNRDQKRFTISVTPELAAEPTEAEKEEWKDVERAWKIHSMMGGLDRHTRHKALEAAE